ncbi:outer membrane beta-barrel protein [Flavobacterium piscis]|uniref:Outer membrane receptor for ferrienterochelin and colicin n=1 Tax=Flavobacterium piscis TaxID=1114874 RepID=A0ABU1Y3P8_9FLAO|nr:outer membrane beta-barrel protein [Flavobacterium piscis]MDR7208851.1 outer membrane receptor for ferrienterochelin and colicin [Flavobacterium piscis]
MKSQILVLFFLFILSNVFCQERRVIEGKILSNEVVLPDILVELKTGTISKFAISNKKGEYKFEYIISNDSVILKVNSFGYKMYDQKIAENNKIGVFDIHLVIDEPEQLKEIIITSDSKIINKAKKNVYKIDQKDYLKNAKAGVVLSSVPNVYFNEFDGKIIVDGNLNAKIFIDGLEAMPDELKNIDAADIKNVEIINNPSAAYFRSDFFGAIINIITQKKAEEFIKGSLETTIGLINNFWGLNPAFSYKKGIFIIKSNLGYVNNPQIIDFNSKRVDENGTFLQSNINHSRNKQISSSTRARLNFSDKSSLTLTNSFYGYDFLGNASGFSIVDNDIPQYFFKDNRNKMKNWNIASVYNYKIEENSIFFVKSAYSTYGKTDVSQFNYEDRSPEYFNVNSKNREFSVQMNYELEKLVFLGKDMDFYSDLKFINRKYDFSDQSYYINQNVIDASAELDSNWSNKFSTELALTFENTNDFNRSINQNYNLLLPTINALYHFKNKTDLKFGYSRKVLRPSASDLNDEVIIIYPGIAKQGNSELNPQLRNYYSLTLSKFFKYDNLSFKIYNESINNAITEVYRKDGDLLIQTLDNAAKYNSTGMNIGFRTKLFEKIITNLNSGLDYNVYEDNSEMAVIEKNSGYTFRGSVNLSTKFFRDRVSMSFSGRQDGPNYSLLSKRITKPYLDFTIATNVLKDKLNISLYGRNLLGKEASGFTDISSYDNFYQKIETKNNSRNLLLILTYNFGKKFSDKIDNQDINNADVRR